MALFYNPCFFHKNLTFRTLGIIAGEERASSNSDSDGTPTPISSSHTSVILRLALVKSSHLWPLAPLLPRSHVGELVRYHHYALIAALRVSL